MCGGDATPLSIYSNYSTPAFTATSARTPTPGIFPSDIAGESSTDAIARSYTKSYHRQVAVPYNMCAHLARNLGTPWMVFALAMAYYHRFVAKAGLHQNPMLLGAACFFLATKSSGISKVRLANIVEVAFESTLARDAKEFEARKQQLISLEAMLLYVLNYDCSILLPWSHCDRIIGNADARTDALVRKFLAYASHIPFCLYFDEKTIAEGVICFVTDSLGCSELYESKLEMLSNQPRVREQFASTMLDYFVFADKRTTEESINQRIEERKRQREAVERQRLVPITSPACRGGA